jgi:hypothetical protein
MVLIRIVLILRMLDENMQSINSISQQCVKDKVLSSLKSSSGGLKRL